MQNFFLLIGVSETTTADPGRQNRDGVIGSVVATVAAIALTTVVIVIIYAWKKYAYFCTYSSF